MRWYENIIKTFKSSMDWYLSKDAASKLSIIVALVLAFFVYKYFRNEHLQDVKQTETLRELELKVESCNKIFENNDKLRERIITLKTDIILLEASNDYLPFPFWIKDKRGRMIYVNKAYEKTYLLPRGLTANDYIDKTDEQIWGPEKAEMFRKNDSLVMVNDNPYTFEEINGQIFTKFPIKIGDHTIGVGGVEYIDYQL